MLLFFVFPRVSYRVIFLLQDAADSNQGNADGLGETRKKELQVSALQLGLKSRDDVTTIDDPYGTYTLYDIAFANIGTVISPTL